MKVREKAKYIFELVTDSFKLKDEKKKFASWKSRIEGVGSSESSTKKKKNFGKDGASAYGATSSSSYGGTISTYYDKNKDRKDKDKIKEKDKEKEKEKEIKAILLLLA